jgi:hypothetical protein
MIERVASRKGAKAQSLIKCEGKNCFFAHFAALGEEIMAI